MKEGIEGDPCPRNRGLPCDHCSNEVEVIINRTGDIVSGIRRDEKRTQKGEFCNNDGQHFVRDLAVCAKTEAMLGHLNLAETEPSELEWMRRRGG